MKFPSAVGPLFRSLLCVKQVVHKLVSRLGLKIRYCKFDFSLMANCNIENYRHCS